MSMRFILLDLDLFSAGADRQDSEEVVLWFLEIVTDLNVRYLQKNPKTPKLYDSGVRYSYPDQMTTCKIPASKLADCKRYLKSIGASDETIEGVVAFLVGMEWFRSIPQILKKGDCDCDNLAPWRAAELRLAGIKATPMITWRDHPEGTTYHALVRWPDGTSEDPSRILGLGSEVERQEEKRKNRERFDTFVEAAQNLCLSGQASPTEVGRRIDSLGLLGKGWQR